MIKNNIKMVIYFAFYPTVPRYHGLVRHDIKLPSELVLPDNIIETPQGSTMNHNICLVPILSGRQMNKI